MWRWWRGRRAPVRSPEEAREVLVALGATSEDLDSHQGLRRFRKRFATTAHPDVGGDESRFSRVNSAVQLLLLLAQPAQPRRPKTPRAKPQSPSVVTAQEVRDFITKARDLGYFRIQMRAYEPYPSMFWKQSGYFGRVEATRTFRRTGKKGLTDDEVADGILAHISATARRVGMDDTDPASLIVQLTLVDPKGSYPGHAAIAWVTRQDTVAQMFGHGTRWYSLSMTMTPGDAKKWESKRTGAPVPPTRKKEEKWNRAKVVSALRGADMEWISGDRNERWASYGTSRRDVTRTRHLILTTRTIKRSDAYMGRGQYYFGELTRSTLDELIRWAGGTPGSRPRGEGPLRQSLRRGE